MDGTGGPVGSLDPDDPPTLTIDELASASGTTPERIHDLVGRGVLTTVGPDRFEPGDIHRIRLIGAFERVGVPLDALVEASRRGQVSFEYYGELHPTPARPSGRTYAEFGASLGRLADRLPDLYGAFGLAEPSATTQLSIDDEAFISELLTRLDALGRPDAGNRAVRAFAEANRRASDAALGIYADVVAELGPEFYGLPADESYAILRPWAGIATFAPALSEWLASKHMSRAIDAFSAVTTERTLEELGYIPDRPTVVPGIAFVDLTGFTRLTEESGDEVAAGLSLRLGDAARAVVGRFGGRVVKLLGDGVLLWFPDMRSAVEGTLDLLDALVTAGLPPGHAGVHGGPVIEREGDIFGRSVNLASRVADVAPSGALYVTAAVLEALEASPGAPGLTIVAGGTPDLQGVGTVPLFRVSRRLPRRGRGAAGPARGRWSSRSSRSSC